jgi:signal transduction histidine kinase
MTINEQVTGKSQDDLDYFSKSIRERLEAYNASPLTVFHDHLLKIFFDLTQQHDGLDSFYQICVSLPLALHTGISTSLAVLNNRKDGFQLAYCSDPDSIIPSHLITNLPLSAETSSSLEEGLLLLPLIAHPLPDSVGGDLSVIDTKSLPCLGVLFIDHYEQLTDIDRLFLEKLVTRMGYNLQRRLLQLSHLDHVNFIKRLGRDIGHNVITPNMHFKNLFRQLEKKIQLIDAEVRETEGMADEQSLRIINRCNEIRTELGSTHEELLGHYNRTSLYLETLLREEHFSKGRFILKKRLCQIEQDIILPELQIYRKRFIRQGISIEQPVNMQERPICLYGDAGLLSQVFDNLFSNALKYTTETVDADGTLRKGIAYGCRDVENFPKRGEMGVKFNLFSTGAHLSADESLTIFNDGVRGENVGYNPGSGHGLAFVRNVVEIHGGDVGYEAVPGGNNFYFILPLSDPT